jgi:hypothetical protein
LGHIDIARQVAHECRLPGKYVPTHRVNEAILHALIAVHDVIGAQAGMPIPPMPPLPITPEESADIRIAIRDLTGERDEPDCD